MAAVAAPPKPPRQRAKPKRSPNTTAPEQLADAQVAEILSRFPFRFEIVPIAMMFVDQDYQRPLTSFADTVENQFNPALVMCLCLSLRKSGKYAVIDGQTRMVATERLGFLGLPALVYEGLSKADEAQIFELIQTARRNASSWTAFRAALVAKNPEALAIRALVESVKGMTVGDAPGSIRSVAALRKAYRIDPGILERALIIIKGWLENQPPQGQLITAMCYFLTRNPDTNDERLERRLKTTGLEELSLRAANLRASKTPVRGSGNAKYLAQAIKNAYDSGK